jgi:ribonuclease T2
MLRLAVRLLSSAFALVLLVLPVDLAIAQDRQNTPGQFDFYVLSLSWSPTFCENANERGDTRHPQQCGERPYAFVVHGLWPQHERGFPGYCQVPAPRLDRNIVNTMLDLMPSPRLVFHEWDRHGTCSGLPARSYFDLVRKARGLVKIPEQYSEIKTTLTVTPSEVEEAFIRANAGLSPGAIAVGCDNRRLRDVRICLTKDLAFRDCPEVDRRACRRDRVVMPPLRGSAAGTNPRAAANQ